MGLGFKGNRGKKSPFINNFCTGIQKKSVKKAIPDPFCPKT
jgi:hypothetical protein